MEKEFVPYVLALELKELGFDEECLAWTIPNEPNFIISPCEKYGERFDKMVQIPTFSQTFRWFREKYNLIFQINYLLNGNYQVVIHKNTHEYMELIQDLNSACVDEIPDNYSYEEAELECLKKLIEIVKDEK